MTTDVEYLDEPPQSAVLTEYDRAHFKLYLHLLDAAAENVDWRQVVSVLFKIDPSDNPERARHIHDTHLARAHWMTTDGYKQLL
ncbi:MAG: DUF2285 domain-containing protein [Hyphomicrobiales bacterium]|nr:DUF2285 domain-containing protein [Hyphomicrobiales bacterium]